VVAPAPAQGLARAREGEPEVVVAILGVAREGVAQLEQVVRGPLAQLAGGAEVDPVTQVRGERLQGADARALVSRAYALADAQRRSDGALAAREERGAVVLRGREGIVRAAPDGP